MIFFKKIENLTSDDFKNPGCFVCFEEIIHRVNFCDKCSFTICNDCFNKIILYNDIYRCPQCRYIPPHYISKDPNLDKPRLSSVIEV